MKPKVTFSGSGNSYGINAPTGNTYTTATPTSFVQRVENAATNLLSGRQTTGTTGVTTYNTTAPATTGNYGTGYGVSRTSGATNINFGYGGTGNTYTTSGVNRATVTSVPVTTGATVVTRPAETYTTSYTAGQTGGVRFTQAPPVNYTTTEVVTVPQTTVQEVRRVESVTQPVTVSQVQRVEHVAPATVHNEIIEEYDRPVYQRLHQNNRIQTRKQAAISDEPVKASKCCGPICWALLALLGLAALVLGLLFGLGVIGGLRGRFDDASAGVDGGASGAANGGYSNYTITTETTIVNTTGTANGTAATNGTTGGNGGTTVIPVVPVIPGGESTTNPNTTYMFPPTVTTTNQTTVVPINPTPILPTTNPGNMTYTDSTTTTVAPIAVAPIQVPPTATTPVTTQPTTVVTQPSTSTIAVSPISVQPVSSSNQASSIQPFSVSPISTQPTATTFTNSAVQPGSVAPIRTQPITSVQPSSTRSTTVSDEEEEQDEDGDEIQNNNDEDEGNDNEDVELDHETSVSKEE